MMTLCLTGCGTKGYSALKEPVSYETPEYATGYKIAWYEDDVCLIEISEQQIVVVPEGISVPEWVEPSMTLICQPVNNVYVAASSVPDLLSQIGCIDKMHYTSTKPSDWGIEAVTNGLNNGSIEYVGKYSAPDYEKLLAEGCDLVIESTMAYHSPEVLEQFEQFDIPVMVEQASYESNPLGRMEWARIYGIIFGKTEATKVFLDDKSELINSISNMENSVSVAFFSISSNGAVIVRKPGDYVSKMIEMAGGNYIIETRPEEENALSTMNMQMEAFYAEAIDADILIYNSTIEGEIDTIQELLDKNEAFKDFKAVKEDRVWCSGKNMFQETGGMADMIEELHAIITGEAKESSLKYFHKLVKED